MVTALSRAQWKIALQQHYRVLKPGGWVQILDLQLPYRLAKDQKRANELLSISQRMWQARDFMLDGFNEIPVIMKEIGFENIAYLEKKLPLGPAGIQSVTEGWFQSLEGAHRAMKEAVLVSGATASEEAFDKLLSEAKRDWNDIPGFECSFFLFTGQKSLLRSHM